MRVKTTSVSRLESFEPLGVPQAKLELLSPDAWEPVVRPGSHVKSGTDIPPPMRASLMSKHMVSHEAELPNTVIDAGQGDASVPDIQTAMLVRDTIRRISGGMRMMGTSFANAEADELDKFQIQKGFSPGWDVSPEIVPRGVERIEGWLHKELDWSKAKIDDSEVKLTARRGTVHGPPTYMAGDEDHLAHVAMALEITSNGGGASAWEKVTLESRQITGTTFLPMTPTCLIGSRTGFTAKDIPLYAYSGHALSLVGVSSSYFCRRRKVYMMSTYENEAIRHVVMRDFMAIKSGHYGANFKHGSSFSTNVKVFQALARAKKRWGSRATIISLDASNFDDSTDFVHLDDEYDRYDCSDPERELLKLNLRGHLCTGPLDDRYPMFMQLQVGGVWSGKISTSADDSRINWKVQHQCARAALGMSVPDYVKEMREGTITIFIQGDDALYIGPDLDEATYVALGAALGYKLKFDRTPVFLKVWHEGPGAFYTFPARAFMTTFSREHRAPGPYHEMLATAIRWQLAWNGPSSRELWAIMQRINPLFQGRRFADPRSLLRYVESNSSVLERERRVPQGQDRWKGMIRDVLRGDDPDETSADDPRFDEAIAFVLRRLGAFAAVAGDRVDLRSAAVTFDWRSYLRRLRRTWDGK